MICRSDHNLEYYPENKPYNFKIKLQQNIELNAAWKVALTEITLLDDFKKGESLFIYSSICGESFINGVKAPLLRRVIARDIGHTIVTPYYYVPVIKSELSELDFRIKDQDGSEGKHLLNPLTLVLHLTSSQVDIV